MEARRPSTSVKDFEARSSYYTTNEYLYFSELFILIPKDIYFYLYKIIVGFFFWFPHFDLNNRALSNLV